MYQAVCLVYLFALNMFVCPLFSSQSAKLGVNNIKTTKYTHIYAGIIGNTFINLIENVFH